MGDRLCLVWLLDRPMVGRAPTVKLLSFQRSVFDLQVRRLGIFLIFLMLGGNQSAWAHIGRPNVFFEGRSGSYQMHVAIRPPAVLPGSAQVDVRISGGHVTYVMLEARLFDAPMAGTLPVVHAARVMGETNFFNGEIWLLRPGAYGVNVVVDGAWGRGTVTVPLNSVTLQSTVMSSTWKGVLIGLGVFLIIGA